MRFLLLLLLPSGQATTRVHSSPARLLVGFLLLPACLPVSHIERAQSRLTSCFAGVLFQIPATINQDSGAAHKGPSVRLQNWRVSAAPRARQADVRDIINLHTWPSLRKHSDRKWRWCPGPELILWCAEAGHASASDRLSICELPGSAGGHQLKPSQQHPVGAIAQTALPWREK